VKQVGNLRDLVTLQSKSVTRDNMGGEVVTWNTVVTLYAERDPAALREALALRRSRGEAAIGFRVRATTAISLDKRLLHGGVGYDIVEIDTTRRHEGELLVTGKAEATS
jgi:SPP1 family predicted phage head-tail adaptor